MTAAAMTGPTPKSPVTLAWMIQGRAETGY
jgi:hypothetical protein